MSKPIRLDTDMKASEKNRNFKVKRH